MLPASGYIIIFIGVALLYRKSLFSFSCIIVFCSVFLFSSCNSSTENNNNEKIITATDWHVDTTVIPHDTIAGNNPALSLTNGLYYLNRKLFSGIVSSQNNDKTITAFISVYNGMKHGLYRSYYSSGAPFEVRQYKNNLATGRHYGYYDNGNMQFDYLYFEEKKAGYFKKWYSNGKPFVFANYKNDCEDGLQQGWRQNGKLFLNYVAKDGRTYGLQETMLCYLLKNERVKNTAAKK